MVYRNQNREPALEVSAELPPYIDAEDLASSLQWTPYIVENGLPEQHTVVFYAGEKRNDLKKMSDDDLVLRAADPDYVCTLRAFQRGYNFIESTTLPNSTHGVQPGTYIGAIETQVLAAKHKGYFAPESQVIAEVEQLMEPVVQESLRDRLFTRIQAITSREATPLEFRSFVEKLAEYDPPYDLDKAQMPASELAMKVFNYQKEKFNQRGIAKIELNRLRQVFDAIGAKNPDVQADKYAIVHHNRIIDVDRPRALVDKALRHLTGKPRARTLERVDNLYTVNFGSYLGKEPESIFSFIPRPSISQEATARALSEASAAAARIAEIDAAKAAQKTILGLSSAGLVAGTLFGAQSANAAERVPTSVISQINTESIAALSSLPNIAEVDTNDANKALKAEIDRRVAHSKQLGGRMAEWETVDADTLYASILKYEKEYNTGPKERFLVLAQLTHESGLKVDAVSVVNAKGMAQFMDGTWKTYGGGRDPFDPDAAVRAQFRYNVHLRKLLKDRFPHMSEEDLTALRIAAYNCGENNHYIKSGQVPPVSFANGQTYHYTKSIMKDYHSLLSMSDTPSTAPQPNTGRYKKHSPNIDTPSFDVTSVLAGTDEVPSSHVDPLVVDAVFKTLAEDTPTPSVTKFDIDAVNANLDALLGVPVGTQTETVAGSDTHADVPQRGQTHENTPPTSPAPLPGDQPPVESLLGDPLTAEPAVPPANPGIPAPVNTPGSLPLTPPPGDTIIDNTPREQNASPALPSIPTTPSQVDIPSLSAIPNTEASSPVPIAPISQLGDGINDITQDVPETPVQQTPQAPATAPGTPSATPGPNNERQNTPTVNDKRKAEIDQLRKSGDFKKSQAQDGAQRSPLEKKLADQGEKNGRLSSVERLGSQWGDASLYAPAAEQFRKLDAAYYQQFGHHITVNDSYRSYSRQVATKKDAISKGRPQFAATPGHSKHGWGLALDLGGGLQSFNSPEYKWMLAHALDYGFNHPDFADDSSSPEPWHWEYVLSE